MKEALVLTSLDDHEAMFQALADMVYDTQIVTQLLDQAAKNGNSYPMHLELTELAERQRNLVRVLIQFSADTVDKFTSTIEQVAVS